MGLYLSDHPMGEVAERVGLFVTAYSGDLKDESLDGQRVVLGGIVTGIRTVMTKARASMAVVTLEDLQGTLEVVVFPRTYETTAGTWRDGAILLVAGRVDHRGDEASLLADSVWDWDAVAEQGPEAFGREVGSLDKRSAAGGSGGPGGNGTAVRAMETARRDLPEPGRARCSPRRSSRWRWVRGPRCFRASSRRSRSHLLGAPRPRRQSGARDAAEPSGDAAAAR